MRTIILPYKDGKTLNYLIQIRSFFVNHQILYIYIYIFKFATILSESDFKVFWLRNNIYYEWIKIEKRDLSTASKILQKPYTIFPKWGPQLEANFLPTSINCAISLCDKFLKFYDHSTFCRNSACVAIPITAAVTPGKLCAYLNASFKYRLGISR